MEFLRSEILNNQNLNIDLNLNVKNILNTDRLNDLFLKIGVVEGYINLSKSSVNWSDDVIIKLNESYLDINENPPIMEKTGQGASAFELLNYYMEYMYPELFVRASHPVFAGTVTANAIDHIGAEESKEWDQVAIMRYRSIRDMLEIANNEIFSERHEYKTNALLKTIAIPVSAPVFLDFRIIIFMILLIITLIIDRLISRK